MTQTIPTTRQADPLLPSPNDGLRLRPGAQQSRGLSADFDRVLQTQLDAVEPATREPEPRESAPTESDDGKTEASDRDPQADAAQDDGDGDSGAKPESESQDTKPTQNTQDSAQEQPAQSESTESKPEAPFQNTAVEVAARETGQPGAPAAATAEVELAKQGVPTGVTAQQRDEQELDRFIQQHGKRASKLRWDSVRAELTHAADADLAEKNATELISRDEKSTPRPISVLGTVPDPAGKPFPNRGGTEFREANTPGPIADPNAVPTKLGSASQAANSQTSLAATTNSTTPTTTVAAAVVQPNAEAPREQAATRNDRAALLSRLGTVGASGTTSQTHASQAGRSTAVVGVGKTHLHTERGKQAASLAKPPRGKEQAAMQQVQRGLAKLIKSEGGTSTLRLSPKSLGEVTVKLQVQHGKASATFTPSSEVARSLLKSGVAELRASLEARGLRVERIAVEPVQVRASAEPTANQVREDARANPSSDGSLHDTRPEAEGETRGGDSGSPQRDPRHGSRSNTHTHDDARSAAVGMDEAAEPASAGERGALGEDWVRLDTVG